MSNNFFLDWAILSVSLINTILLLWLGLTVLLNAENRNWGVWLTGGGFLLGAAFFLSHSIILGYGFNYFNWGINFWWRFGWIPVILAPFAWYVVMLWYSGYWEGKYSRVYKRHRVWFISIILITISMIALLSFANPLPSISQVALLDISASPSIFGIPIIILFYPFYILLCIGLALDALQHPGPTERVMGEQARYRARPWLFGATLVLLFVSILVGFTMFWVVLNTRQYRLDANLPVNIAWFDLVIATLITTAVIFTGQAVVSYEVFTGKVLPSRGLMRYWQRAIILAVGYGTAVSFTLQLNIQPIYSLVLSTFLMIVFYALLSWRAYKDREQIIANLRPFINRSQSYAQLVAPNTTQMKSDRSAVIETFQFTCKDILDTELACLIPVGPLAPLFGDPLSFPGDLEITALNTSWLLSDFQEFRSMFVPLDPREFSGAVWAISLWNENGLCGFILLGKKRGGGVYTQEEISFAQSTGERLIDSQASSELAKRLMALQRRQFVESQVIDQNTRRTMHDDILPKLHSVILLLSRESAEKKNTVKESMKLLGEIHHQISDLLHVLPSVQSGKIPAARLIASLQQVIQGELKNVFNEVIWEIEPDIQQKISQIPDIKSQVIYYAAREVMRNASQHARDSKHSIPLELLISINWNDGLEVSIQDNGIGINIQNKDSIQNGHGLGLHSTILAVIGGALSVESIPGEFTRVIISLPKEAFDYIDQIGSEPQQ
jgi:signal transduction histidine kinase